MAQLKYSVRWMGCAGEQIDSFATMAEAQARWDSLQKQGFQPTIY